MTTGDARMRGPAESRLRRELPGADEASGEPSRGDSWVLVRELGRHGVKYVLFGSGGARAHGARLPVGDIDICPEPDPRNLERQVGVNVGEETDPDGRTVHGFKWLEGQAPALPRLLAW